MLDLGPYKACSVRIDTTNNHKQLKYGRFLDTNSNISNIRNDLITCYLSLNVANCQSVTFVFTESMLWSSVNWIWFMIIFMNISIIRPFVTIQHSCSWEESRQPERYVLTGITLLLFHLFIYLFFLLIEACLCLLLMLMLHLNLNLFWMLLPTAVFY